MAELQVVAVSQTHSDPVKDARGCWKRGDIVRVCPDGHQWGALELKAPANGGRFVIVKITDVTVDQVIRWVKNRWNCSLEAEEIQGTIPDTRLLEEGILRLIPNRIRKRRVRIDADLLPAGVRSTLNNTGQFSTTWTAIRQYVRDKLTNETGDGSAIE